MNKSMYLNKLLDGKSVEWKKLNEILVRSKGTKITASEMKKIDKKNAPLKIFAGGKTVAYVNFNDIPLKDIIKEPSIIVKSRGFIEFDFYDKPFSHKNEMWSYYSNDNRIYIKYVYYFLKVNEFYFQNIGNRMQMPQISTPDTDNFKIPIPCPENPQKSLEIQMEIAITLDELTETHEKLITKLKNEINLRKKQYEYYREKILNFDRKNVERIKLVDICKIETGKLNANAAVENGKYVFFTTAKDDSKIDTYRWDTEALLISGDANVGEVKHYVGKFEAYQRTYVLTNFNLKIDPKYIYYILKNDFIKYLENKSNKAAMTYIVLPTLENFKVPIPYKLKSEKSLEKQMEIVITLDELTETIEKLIKKLNKEIELRQKQYEYYRNLLFDFPK